MSERRIGLWGAVATLVGYVIGASIFVLPAELLPSLGSGIVLAYLLAAIPAVFTCVAGAVIGNVFPVSGATVVAVREVLGPRIAFVVAWLLLWASALGTALVAWGFADYAAFVFPGLDARATALGVVLAFVLLNLTPTTVAVAVQGAMVIAFAVVISGFATGGLMMGDWSAVAAPPDGMTPVLEGAVAAYFSYAGLQVVIDIGGEIRDPGRTIPRALAVAFGLVLLLYGTFTLAVVLLAGGAATEAGASALIARIASTRFGSWAGTAIVASALLAAATSIHGIVLTQARDLQALATTGPLPRRLASAPHGIPRPAVLTLGAMALAATALGASVRDYAVLTALCLMGVQGVLGLTVVRIPHRVAAAWARSAFRPAPGVLAFFGWGLVVVSGLFFVIGASQSMANLGWFGGLALAGAAIATRDRTYGPGEVS